MARHCLTSGCIIKLRASDPHADCYKHRGCADRVIPCDVCAEATEADLEHTATLFDNWVERSKRSASASSTRLSEISATPAPSGGGSIVASSGTQQPGEGAGEQFYLVPMQNPAVQYQNPMGGFPPGFPMPTPFMFQQWMQQMAQQNVNRMTPSATVSIPPAERERSRSKSRSRSRARSRSAVRSETRPSSVARRRSRSRSRSTERSRHRSTRRSHESTRDDREKAESKRSSTSSRQGERRRSGSGTRDTRSRSRDRSSRRSSIAQDRNSDDFRFGHQSNITNIRGFHVKKC